MTTNVNWLNSAHPVISTKTDVSRANVDKPHRLADRSANGSTESQNHRFCKIISKINLSYYTYISCNVYTILL